jgi:hypothetical protein
MNRKISLTLVTACLLAGASQVQAQNADNGGGSGQKSSAKFVLPAGITEEMLAPPPVPRFMLEKPAKPLSVDEMVQQAHEAESKAGARPKVVKSQSDTSATKPTK